MSISVTNTDAGLTGTTLLNGESAQTVTGLKNFDRDPNAPFTVSSGSAVVTNLDADKLDGLEATAFVKADGTVAMTGALTMTSGQIAFPATQVPSAGVNVLDDYEEGTFTPSLGGTATYSTQTGTYTKIGNRVFVSINLTVTLIGTGSTTTISGLPFTAAELSAGSVAYFTTAAGSTAWVGCYADTATVVFRTQAAIDNGNDGGAFFGNGTAVIATVNYKV